MTYDLLKLKLEQPVYIYTFIKFMNAYMNTNVYPYACTNLFTTTCSAYDPYSVPANVKNSSNVTEATTI